MVLMQTKGGGKHDILSVARATVTTLECLWMMPRDPDAVMCLDSPAADEHGGVHGASELCSISDQDRAASNPSERRRVSSRVRL
jgi:hypothetical protein